jgi:hypothetical protein
MNPHPGIPDPTHSGCGGREEAHSSPGPGGGRWKPLNTGIQSLLPCHLDTGKVPCGRLRLVGMTKPREPWEAG